MTDGQIKIRKARICDIDEIIELERECFTDEAWD